MEENAVPRIEIVDEQCKGCELCVIECPPKVIHMTEKINHLGYPIAAYDGDGCTGCGVCFYACPEPGTIRVFKK